MSKSGKKASWSSISRILAYIWKNHPLKLSLALVLIVAASLVTVYITSSIRVLIDQFILPLLAAEEKDFGPLASFLLNLGLIGIFGAFANYLFNFMLAIISQDTLRGLRNQVFAKMQGLPVKYFDSHAHGDIMSVYTNDIDSLRQAIEQSIPQFLVSIITISGVTVSMLRISPQLFLLVFLMLVIMFFTARAITKKAKVYFKNQQANLGAENGYIEEMIAGQKVVKAFVHEEEVMTDFERYNQALFESSSKANSYGNILFPTIGNLGNVSYVLIAVLGGYFSVTGMAGITIGGLVTFLQLNRSLVQPIANVTQQLNFVLMALAGGDRIFDLLDQEDEVNEGQVTLVNYKQVDQQLVETTEKTGLWAWKHPQTDGSFSLIPLVGKVVFENVNFAYDADHQVLFDIDLYAEQGQKIAFVGATGAGKTTITNLINRFYEIQSGMITYDGIDIRLIDKASLRKSLGIVLQDTHLFTGTIAENIAYGNEAASRDEILAAAKLSNVDRFVKNLENGYDAQISGDGAGLSNGQRQLIAIARAALANAPVLILDEATSSIDSLTEKMVQEGMDKLMQGRTVFVIAHRLSTIVNSDVIMVMDHGRIVERGNHAELMEKKGVYYRLYTGGLEID
ncbi:ABC transporter ATP-binding protein/permease [Streptococcus suis]